MKNFMKSVDIFGKPCYNVKKYFTKDADKFLFVSFFIFINWNRGDRNVVFRKNNVK